MEQDIYSHLPRGSIRLLEILPNQDNEANMQCRLLHFSLHESNIPDYEALSYIWGDRSSLTIYYIFIEGRQIHVLQNLHLALCRLRNRFTSRFIWADAICINQANTDEKSEQVYLMPKIFSYAHRTVCWVPLELPDSALRLISELQQFHHSVAQGGTIVSESDIYHSNYKISSSDLDRFHQDWRFGDAEAWRSLKKFLDNPYFQRVWIRQDWICSKLPVLYSVSNELSWKEFCNGLEVAHFFSTYNLPSSLGLISVLTAEYLRQRQTLSSCVSLSYKDYVLAQLTCTCFATSHQDYVYAIQSTITATGQKPFLTPHYSKPLNKVYTEAAEELGLLSLSLTKRRTSLSTDFPSWVPDWSCNLESFLLNHTRSNFSASLRPYSTTSYRRMGDLYLQCSCLQVDKVLKVSSYLPPRRHYDHYNVDGANILIFDEWHEFATNSAKGFPRTPAREAEILLQYADTIQARGCNSIWESDIPMEPNRLVTKTQGFIRYLNDESTKATMDIRLFYAACFPSHDRRFGVTERGFFCLVPQETKRGDLVCVPHGSMVPIIFREEGHRFKNVGEAYVNGLMKGEGEGLGDLKDMVLEMA
ncbi:heterokaryon incompatibility protein-domain-containing protein [Fusarium oxysporum f. sp. albedinis]|nr:heterokaryon incompatibility protein-domain-containing protein [Fusarium oxysporum f. sp. albedinis]